MTALALGSVVTYLQNKRVSKTVYELPISDLPVALEGFKIIQLSDIHFPNAILDVAHLIKQVNLVKPDMIVITGNVITAQATYDRKELTYFMQGLVHIAPTYVVSGYHEYKMKNPEKFKQDVQEAGAIYLENDTVWHQHKNAGLLVMGLDEKTAQQTKDSLYLRRISVPDEYAFDVKILLAHHPEWFLYYHTEEEKLPDVTFSGYARGGHIRIPGVGGLFAESQGAMPQYTEGVFSHPILDDKLLVVSRGIGTPKKWAVRINNKPELVVVVLTKK